MCQRPLCCFEVVIWLPSLVCVAFNMASILGRALIFTTIEVVKKGRAHYNSVISVYYSNVADSIVGSVTSSETKILHGPLSLTLLEVILKNTYFYMWWL